MEVQDIEPWMPNGYGRQHLYPLTVGVGAEWVEKRIGFRTLEVKTNEDAQGGKSMTFCVNGRDILLQGRQLDTLGCLSSANDPKQVSATASGCD